MVEVLLRKDGIEVNQPDKDGFTPLYMAALKGHEEVVSLLLGYEGNTVNQAENDGDTPLIMAAFNGHVKVV